MKLMRQISLMFLLLALMIPAVSAQDGELQIEGGEVIATGLNLPQGVLVDADGNVWVIDSGVGGEDTVNFFAPGAAEAAPSPFGMSARVIMISPEGEQNEFAFLPSIVAGTDIVGGARLAVLDGALYATSGQWIEFNGPDRGDLMGSVVTFAEDGTPSEVASTWAFEEANNPDGFAIDSHPYGLAAGPDGWLWVADAGANSLLRVDPATGDTELVASFEGLFGPFPNAERGDAMESDPVPTGIAFDSDGNAYVSLLSGFPFLPGGTKVVTIGEDNSVSDYATGLTMLTDLRMGPDGEMYAVQVAQFGEQGPVPNSGAIIRVKAGEESQVVVDGLPSPTSISFDADGNAYVTVNGGFAPPGIGALVKFAGLTAMEGTPIMEMGQ